MKAALAVLAISALGFVGITYVALEGNGVVTVITQAEDGSARETHIWYVKNNQRLHLEAGNPANPWVQDLRQGSRLYLQGEGLNGYYDYQILPGDESHRWIRAQMRSKYGWRDAWISLLFDVSQSQRLDLTTRQGRSH